MTAAFPILALDLGSQCGYAYAASPETPVFAGTWELATPAQLRKARKTDAGLRGHDPRMTALAVQLEALVGVCRTVVWEDVQFSSSTAQTQLWASFRGVLWEVIRKCPARPATMPVPVGTLKKWATGSGAADKDAMAAAWAARKSSVPVEHPLNERLDDNAIDALWLLTYAQTHAQ